MQYSVNKLKEFSGNFKLPASKSLTQRAILCAAIADGISIVENDLRCQETTLMKEACRAFGAVVEEHQSYIKIKGTAGKLKFDQHKINCGGSALVFRVFVALACFSEKPVELNGDKTLSKRIMQPFFSSLISLGASIQHLENKDFAPVLNRAISLTGRDCTIPGDVSSQFSTALLFAGLFCSENLRIKIIGEIYSKSYIEQTIAYLEKHGASLIYTKDLREIEVIPGVLKASVHQIPCDYTSASYLFVCNAILPGKCCYQGIKYGTLQGEEEILHIIQSIDGVVFESDLENKKLCITNLGLQKYKEYHFNISTGPNILPSLAVLAAFTNGRFIVSGAKLTQSHKCPRISKVIAELQKLNVDIKPLYDKEKNIDGFICQGKKNYNNKVFFDCHKDHRLFLSLLVASFAIEAETWIEAEDASVACSFPDFLSNFPEKSVQRIESKKTAALSR